MQSTGLSRRKFLKVVAASAAFGAASALRRYPTLAASTQREWRVTGQDVPSLASFDQTLQKFMQERNIPGGALAVTRHGKLALARGYTWSADPNETVQPTSTFRIASLTKRTSASIMQLVQQSKLQLTQKLVDVLDMVPLPKQQADPQLKNITILHLLQHLGGWDRDTTFDPMFRDRIIARELRVSLPITPQNIITYMNGQPLQFKPGTKYVYSNYGYCILGRVIEQISGELYGDYVLKNVLGPLGIKNMKLGSSLQDKRFPGEIAYYTADNRTFESVFAIKQKVPIPYGTFNLENMDSHGRWLASPVDLVRFASSFDNPAASPILGGEAINTIFAVPSIGIGSDGSYYGCGWQVRPVGALQNTWHTGSLPGTSTIMVRRWDGLNWAALFNQRDDPSGKNYDAIDGLLHEAADAVRQWPDYDLFDNYLAAS